MIITFRDEPEYGEIFKSNWDLIFPDGSNTFQQLFKSAKIMWPDWPVKAQYSEFKITIWDVIPILSQRKVVEILGDSENTTGYLFDNNTVFRLYYDKGLYAREINWFSNVGKEAIVPGSTMLPKLHDHSHLFANGIPFGAWALTSRMVPLESFVNFMHNDKLSKYDLEMMNSLLYNISDICHGAIDDAHDTHRILLPEAIQMVLVELHKRLKIGGTFFPHKDTSVIYKKFPRGLIIPIIMAVLRFERQADDQRFLDIGLSTIGVDIGNPQKVSIFSL